MPTAQKRKPVEQLVSGEPKLPRRVTLRMGEHKGQVELVKVRDGLFRSRFILIEQNGEEDSIQRTSYSVQEHRTADDGVKALTALQSSMQEEGWLPVSRGGMGKPVKSAGDVTDLMKYLKGKERGRK